MEEKIRGEWTTEEQEAVKSFFKIESFNQTSFTENENDYFFQETSQNNQNTFEEILKEKQDPLGLDDKSYFSFIKKSELRAKRNKKTVVLSEQSFDSVFFLSAIHGDKTLSEMKEGKEYLKKEMKEKVDTMKILVQENPIKFFMSKNLLDKEYNIMLERGLIGRAEITNCSQDAAQTLNSKIETQYGALFKKEEKEEKIRKRLDIISKYSFIFRFRKKVQLANTKEDFEECVFDYKKAILELENTSVPETLKTVWKKSISGVSELKQKIIFIIKKNVFSSNGLVSLLLSIDNEPDFLFFILDDFLKELFQVFDSLFSIDSLEKENYLNSYFQLSSERRPIDGVLKSKLFIEQKKIFVSLFGVIRNIFISSSEIYSFLLSSTDLEKEDTKTLKDKIFEIEEKEKKFFQQIFEKWFLVFEQQKTKLFCFQDVFLFSEFNKRYSFLLFDLEQENISKECKESLRSYQKKFSETNINKTWEKTIQEIPELLSISFKPKQIKKEEEAMKVISFLMNTTVSEFGAMFEAYVENVSLFLDGMSSFVLLLIERVLYLKWNEENTLVENFICSIEFLFLYKNYLKIQKKHFLIEQEIVEETFETLLLTIDDKIKSLWSNIINNKKERISNIVFNGIRKTFKDWETEWSPQEVSSFVIETLKEFFSNGCQRDCFSSKRLIVELVPIVGAILRDNHSKQKVYGCGGYLQTKLDVCVLFEVFSSLCLKENEKVFNEIIEESKRRCKTTPSSELEKKVSEMISKTVESFKSHTAFLKEAKTVIDGGKTRG